MSDQSISKNLSVEPRDCTSSWKTIVARARLLFCFESFRAKSFVRKRESNRERSYIDRKWRARTSAEQGFFLVKAKKKSSLGIGLAILTALKEAERN